MSWLISWYLGSPSTQGFSTQYHRKSLCFSFKHLITKNRTETLGTVSTVACSLSFLSEHTGSLCTGVQQSQTRKRDSVCSFAYQGLLFQALLSAVPTALVVSFPEQLPRAGRQLGEGEVKQWDRFLWKRGGRTVSLLPGCLQTERLVWKSKIAMETFISAYT